MPTNTTLPQSQTYDDILQQNDFNIDRVNVETITGNSGEYMYCPGGIITCPTGNLIDKNDTSYFGTTYDFHCQDACGNKTDEHVTCSNKLRNMGNNLTLGSGCDETSADYTTTNINGIESLTDTSGNEYNGLNGFTSPYTHIPMTISGEYVLFYQDNSDAYNKIKRCFLSENMNCCDTNNTSAQPSTTTEQPTSDDISGAQPTTTDTNMDNTLKCVADNGANVGDPLCCGQEGVVQNTNHNCPAEYPKCMGYVCGQTWGQCSAAQS